MPRVLMIGLDGFEISLAEAMMSEGRMPHLRALKERSARFRLDHGDAKYSGLAWEHVSAGLAPADGGRWSAVAFDPKKYAVRQPFGQARPFIADLPVKTVAFDLPYCDFSNAGGVEGVSDWGAHDPGAKAGGRPDGLLAEVRDRFGAYPAREWIYGLSWPSVAKTQRLGDDLAKAVRVRAEAAKWLLAERLPDWDLGIVVVSEPHSAAEPLWHGVDPSHPLHGIESAKASAAALRRVYQATDALIGTLVEAFHDTAVMVFAMHGMGPNRADVAAMALLPELLYRHAFGRNHMQRHDWPLHLPHGIPLLDPDAIWETAMNAVVPVAPPWRKRLRKLRRRLGLHAGATSPEGNIAWMPSARYAAYWPKMPAFALPSFYDGRIRINLAGREAAGRVSLDRYEAYREELAMLIRECRDAITGEPVAQDVSFFDKPAMELEPWDADIFVRFASAPLGFTHPRLGTIGPLPYRRTGGHTGDWGFLYVNAPRLPPRAEQRASAFDVVPTAIDLLGLPAGIARSGRSLAAPKEFVA